ncbi:MULTISPECIES: radical SAM protein [unclassified Pseudodesulfovibrio]|uniref:radical SAM protein n=1 Tax=unclassified Pseudodesulfovibrio TaxID=2661612 RepID=UPI0019D4569A|nr:MULTISPECIES: radical SAM protein [unclassified Pseudodesulfovibrio]
MKTVSCLAPWMCLILSDAGYGPCCHHKFPAKKQLIDQACANPENLIRLFNDENLMQLRSQLLNNTPPRNCIACIKSGYNLGLEDIIKVTKKNGMLQEYTDAIRDGIAKGRKLDGLHPVTIHLSKDAPCNLRCTFCEGAPPAPQDADSAEASFRMLFNTMDTIGWDRVNEIYFAGGEPFFNPGLTRFLNSYDWSSLNEVSIATVSNATLLHQHFDVLKTMDRFYIRLSLDATGETYAKLRRGASWNRVEKNIRELSEIKKTKPNWTVEIHSILMKSTVPFIKEMVQIAHDLDFDFSVNSIRGNYLDENIFFFKDLLEGLDWKNELGEAIDRAQRYGFDTAVQTLKHLTRSLEAVATGGKADIQTLACPNKRLKMFGSFFSALADTRYALWGTDHNLLDFLQKEPILAGLRFIVDHPASIRSYYGHDYYPSQMLAENRDLLDSLAGQVETLVVTAPTYKAEAVIKEARSHFPDHTILVRPFWDQDAQQRMHELAESQEPFVAFGAGGAARLLLSHSVLKDANVVALTDNNKALHGTELFGKPVIRPEDILHHATTVVILSEAFYDEIREQLLALYGDAITIAPLF